MDNFAQLTTPLMKQYAEIKQQFAHALVLFQVGDFYELFFEDAKKAAAFLGITLTSRSKNSENPIPLCGVPVHSLNHYLSKLVRGGFHVAICDQLEEAVPGKVVRRGVTQVFTPGTLIDDNLLDAKSPSYLLSWIPAQDQWGLVFAELLTAQLYATTIPAESLRAFEAELCRFYPDEIIIPENVKSNKYLADVHRMGYNVTINSYDLANTDGADWINTQFAMPNVGSNQAVFQHGLLNFYWYVRRNQERALHEFKKIHFYKPEDFLMLDAATQRNLEIVKNNQDGGRSNTLYSLLDAAATPMGSRAVKKWLVRPLLQQELIVQRQTVVQLFIDQSIMRHKVFDIFRNMGDFERIVGRMALSRATIQDYRALVHMLQSLLNVCDELSHYRSTPIVEQLLNFKETFKPLLHLLQAAICQEDDQGWIIQSGFDQLLDEARTLVQNSSNVLLQLEQREQQRTRINSLKIGYNQVFGYYIEITKANLAAVPSDYIRHQTLAGKERFTLPELKTLEHEIVAARVRMQEREQEVFGQIKQEIMPYITALRKVAHTVGQIDALLGFAFIAHQYGYVRPQFTNEFRLAINEGKHPVIHKKLGSKFIANDTHMSEEAKMFIITGPNMGGKSTYLRQVALIGLMAQCGSFVPARHATLPLFDRIFTRIGSGDNLAEGKSTFLVEMEETAAICTYATKKSLIVLDEVGRGTSTFDGLAIAQAVIEYLYTTVGAFCFFATHYHELTQLEKTFPGIVSYYAASKKNEQGVLLLYKMVRGIADGSFGISVARLAHLPNAIINRANIILNEHLRNQEQLKITLDSADDVEVVKNLSEQVKNLEQKVRKQELLTRALQEINLNETSPKQVYDIVWKLRSDNIF